LRVSTRSSKPFIFALCLEWGIGDALLLADPERRLADMKRTLGLILVLFALSLGAFTAPAGTATASRWPAIQERAFLANCKITSHGNVSACRCELHWLEAHYSFRQITTYYLHDRQRMIRILLRAAAACR
jgi:hypothetical protein